MSTQATRLTKQAASLETSANPPPRVMPEAADVNLFQTMDVLRTRHMDAPNTRQRILLLIAGLLAGVGVFAALYLLMLTVE